MLRNIPSRYSQQSLLAEIRAAGFDPDFFYLPMDFQRDANSGYAFLNLDPEVVQRFRRRYDGQRLAHRSGKLLQVVPAVTQGYEANYEKFAHSAVLNHHKPEHAPIFMRDTSRARMPRARPVAWSSAGNSQGSGLYLLRELPKMYSEEMVAMELLHHGCADSVASLQVPTDGAGLNAGYALIRFHNGMAAACQRVLQGASFHLAPAALPMSLHEVQAQGQPQQVPVVPVSTPLRADAAEFVPAPAPEEQPEVEEATDAPVTPEKKREPTAWERYAQLLQQVPTEQWSGELLLQHFGPQELEEMQAVALATLQESERGKPDRFAELGIDLDDEAHWPGLGTARELFSHDDALDATPQYVPWRMEASPAAAASETPVLKAQPQPLKQPARQSSTPPTRSQSSGSSRSASPCEAQCDLAKVPFTPFDLVSGNAAHGPAPSTPPSEKRVRFSEQVRTHPFDSENPASPGASTSESPALCSRRALPPPPPSGP